MDLLERNLHFCSARYIANLIWAPSTSAYAENHIPSVVLTRFWNLPPYSCRRRFRQNAPKLAWCYGRICFSFSLGPIPASLVSQPCLYLTLSTSSTSIWPDDEHLMDSSTYHWSLMTSPDTDSILLVFTHNDLTLLITPRLDSLRLVVTYCDSTLLTMTRIATWSLESAQPPVFSI